jgi:hypothetical protein
MSISQTHSSAHKKEHTSIYFNKRKQRPAAVSKDYNYYNKTMNGFVQATPAPQVEPAVAEKAQIEDAAIADMAPPTEAAIAERAQIVDAARTCDDPMLFAPENVRNPDKVARCPLSVEALRLESVADNNNTFECYAAVLQGPPSKSMLRLCVPCVFDERDFVSYGEIRKYIFVRGCHGGYQTCFVFGDKTDPSPLYGINLNEFDAYMEDPENPDPNGVTISPVPNTNKPRKEMITILLRYRTNRQHAYQFTFDTSNDPTLANRFLDLFKQNDNKKGTKEGGYAVSVPGNVPKSKVPDVK